MKVQLTLVWSLLVLLSLPVAVCAQDSCEDGLLGAPVLTLKHLSTELAPESVSALERAIRLTSEGGNTELNSDGHAFDEPYHLNIAVDAGPGLGAQVYRLGMSTVFKQLKGVTAAVSEIQLSSGQRSSFFGAAWDAVMDARRSRGGYDLFTEQTEIRFAKREGKLVYFEAWTRRVHRFHTEVTNHVRLGQPQ